MARDRFVRFKERQPTRDQVGTVCEDYLKGLGTAEWDKEGARFFCYLHGTTSHPLRRIEGAYLIPAQEGFNGRYIEVCVTKNCVDVLTRGQDEVTNAIADGLAAVFARFWQGELDDV